MVEQSRRVLEHPLPAGVVLFPPSERQSFFIACDVFDIACGMGGMEKGHSHKKSELAGLVRSCNFKAREA
jgi:hypothetical protein